MRVMIPLCLALVACQAEPATPKDTSPEAPVASQAASDPGRPVLDLPIACRVGVDCEIQNYVDRDPGPEALDYQCGSRTYEDHTGVDFRLPDMAALEAGVAVLAAAPGVVARVRDGVTDVSVDTIGAAAVEGAECGNGIVIEHGGGWTTQYCHLRRGSVAVAPGERVVAGQSIAQVGLSGNTEYAHLHLTVRHDSNVIDPFAPGAGGAEGRTCGAGPGLWSAEAAGVLTYKAGAVLNTGFSGGPVEMSEVEAGALPRAAAADAPLIAYVRAIGLKAGDVQSLRVTGPTGSVVSETVADPLPRNQAQRLFYAGRRAPGGGWPPGRYLADYEVRREGAVVIERRFEIEL